MTLTAVHRGLGQFGFQTLVFTFHGCRFLDGDGGVEGLAV